MSDAGNDDVLAGLYAELERLAARAGLDPAEMPQARNRNQEDLRWIEAGPGEGEFRLVQAVRGSRHVEAAGSREEVLYRAAAVGVTFTAVRLEFQALRPGANRREALFRIQRELFGRMRLDWAERRRAKQAALLAENPQMRPVDLSGP